jgi:DNA polymerase I-like protein with 3'-5' exonuclease and polymerase domains
MVGDCMGSLVYFGGGTMNIIYVTERDQPHISYQQKRLADVEIPEESCLDLETTGLTFNKNKVLLVILGDRNTQYVIDYVSVDKGLLAEKLSKIKKFIGHNLSFDLPFLIYEGFTFNTSQIFDTMETELTLVKGTNHSVSLLNTVKRRLDIETFDKGITIEFTYMNGNSPYFQDRHIEYAAKDILYLQELRDVQMTYINKLNQYDLVRANNDMVVVVSYMKVDGIKLDVSKWMETYHTNLKRSDELEVLMDEELSKKGFKQRTRIKERTVQTDIFNQGSSVVNKNLANINYSSSDQIKLIFRHFKQPIPKINKKVKGVTESKDTTGANELAEYLLDYPLSPIKDFLVLLLEYKIIKKRISTYGREFLIQHCDDNNKIHPTYRVNRTATGRLSSSEPNAQNIPHIKAFRSCFVGEDENLLWTCDLGSAELRILASLSNDIVMKKLYQDGTDFHSYLATPVLRYLSGDKEVNVTKKTHPEFRNTMKTVNFGICYGASGSKVSKVLNISKYQGEHVLDILGSVIPNAFKYLESQEIKAQTEGLIVFEKKWNQIRYFEPVLKKEKISRERLAGIGREGKNVALQGVNSQMVKLAMVNIFNYLRENNLKSKLVLSVHDELVVEVIPDEVQHCEVYERIMIESSNYFLDGVVMEVEKNIGKEWDK